MTADLTLPRQLLTDGVHAIPAASHESFTTRFGVAFPQPDFLSSELGLTAVYDLPPRSGIIGRRVLMVHGLNTPGLGLWPLAKELQILDPSANVVLFDLWGHGLSSTPMAPHSPQIFHSQILQVLAFKQWPSAHVIGYSFGGSTAVSFTNHNPWATQSVILVATSGLLQKSDFSAHMRDLLDDPGPREEEAKIEILRFLEDGSLLVPEDWEVRSGRGEVVAEAIRQWERESHPGFPHSVLSMFRYGGVTGYEDRFREFSRLPTKKAAVIADGDSVCSEEQLNGLGLEHVVVVLDADHELVRKKPKEVAAIVHQFWQAWSSSEKS